MAAPKFPNFDSPDGRPSRRGFLQGIVTAPVAMAVRKIPLTLQTVALDRQMEEFEDPPILCRSREGRSFSRRRYHVAEEFFPDDTAPTMAGWNDYLYQAGITAQLALSSYLLDVGFDDQWCARRIGLHVDRSLAYARGAGFAHASPTLTRLASVLSPYCKWNKVRMPAQPPPDDGSFTVPAVNELLRELLDRVRDTTGHPRRSVRNRQR